MGLCMTSHLNDRSSCNALQDETVLSLLDLPSLPSNARFVFHGENKCFDYGTVGWLMEEGEIDPNRYRYFIFMNSSIR